MNYREFEIEPVDIGGGFVATNVWVSVGPIVLIHSINQQNGAEVNSRLDLHKRVFIDPLPGERNLGGISHLVSSVESASRGWSPSEFGRRM